MIRGQIGMYLDGDKSTSNWLKYFVDDLDYVSEGFPLSSNVLLRVVAPHAIMITSNIFNEEEL